MSLINLIIIFKIYIKITWKSNTFIFNKHPYLFIYKYSKQSIKNNIN